MTKTRDRGTLELAKARGRRRRRRSVSARTGAPYLLEKLLAELRYPLHDCRSCGFEMAKRADGFWWCENCSELGASRRRRSYVGSQIGRSS
jgi:ribosomal protein L37AE/L43A